MDEAEREWFRKTLAEYNSKSPLRYWFDLDLTDKPERDLLRGMFEYWKTVEDMGVPACACPTEMFGIPIQRTKQVFTESVEAEMRSKNLGDILGAIPDFPLPDDNKPHFECEITEDI